MARVAAILAALALGAAAVAEAGSFKVAQDAFMRDGQPMQIRSGSFHYHRAHPSTWADRLQRMAAMGLNALQTYIVWNLHETAHSDGSYNYDFASPGKNLSYLFELAQQNNMLVLLRAGPYICGEHDFGGFPARLLAINNMTLRTFNPQYIAEVDAWWAQLLPQLKPWIYSNGGPIAMVQIENEYGSYGNTAGNAADKAYMEHLKDSVYAALGGPAAIQLYTTDGGSVGYLTGGTLPGEVFATGDWGPDLDPVSHFQAADQFNPAGMRAHTDSEYYTGWLTHWGEGMANTSSMGVVGGLTAILANNGSFNLYMAFGGTNWGFHNGANGGGSSFQPVITSYDYDSPISEGGGHGYGPDGDKYAAIRKILAYWAPDGTVFPPEPAAPTVTAYGPVVMDAAAPFIPNLGALAPKVYSGYSAPPTFETVNASQGYMVYITTLPSGLKPNTKGQYALSISNVADRAEAFLDGVSQGVTYRPSPSAITLDANSVTPGNELLLLVENMGHINYGHGMFDPKGINGPVSINGVQVNGSWTAAPVQLLNFSNVVQRLQWGPVSPSTIPSGPAFYAGTLTITGAPTDTYISVCGWNKGNIWINNFHLGRYWDTEGPQHAYYVPAALLSTGDNDVFLLEQHAPAGNVTVSFGDKPDFTGAVCGRRSDAAAVKAPSSAGARASDVRSPVGAACAAQPTAGTNISLQTCSSAPSSATHWNFTLVRAAADAGVISPASDPSLCIVQHGTNPTTGSPNLALEPCAAGYSDRSQHLIYFGEIGKAFLSPVTGYCFDVAGGGGSPGQRVEFYSCTGNSNQAWTLRADGTITSDASGLCLAAC